MTANLFSFTAMAICIAPFEVILFRARLSFSSGSESVLSVAQKMLTSRSDAVLSERSRAVSDSKSGMHAATAMEAIERADACGRVALIVPLFLNPLPEGVLTAATSATRRSAFLEGPPPATIGDRLACEHWALWEQGDEPDASEASARLAERLVSWLRH